MDCNFLCDAVAAFSRGRKCDPQLAGSKTGSRQYAGQVQPVLPHVCNGEVITRVGMMASRPSPDCSTVYAPAAPPLPDYRPRSRVVIWVRVLPIDECHLFIIAELGSLTPYPSNLGESFTFHEPQRQVIIRMLFSDCFHGDEGRGAGDMGKVRDFFTQHDAIFADVGCADLQ